MRIAIDALGITQFGGGRSATLNLLAALLRVDAENDYLIFVDQEEPALRAANARQWVCRVRGRFASRLWAQLALPIILRQERVALLHHVKNLGAFLTPGKTVVTVYDLSVLIYPEIYPLGDRLYWRWIEPTTLRRAHRVIAISQDTARDLERFYGLPREFIEVIYPGYDPRFRPLSKLEIATVRQKYRLPDRFILHVGSISRKKNLLPVVHALARLVEQGEAIKLALVGRVYGKARDDELWREIETDDLSAHVLCLGPVPDEDLPAIYNCATLLAFPSLQEGFGIVPLEAMACGLPVVTSGAGAVREVVAEAALFVEDASSELAWASALQHVLHDAEAHQRMRLLGLARAQQFSNEESARRLLRLYSEVAKGRVAS